MTGVKRLMPKYVLNIINDTSILLLLMLFVLFQSGLIDEIRKSNVKWENAEENLLNFIKTHVKYQRTVPLAGNSIWMDRFFLRKHMPIVDEYLHYRIIDVSSIKELVR